MNLWAKFSKLLGGGPVQIVEVTVVYSAFGDVQFDGIVLPGTAAGARENTSRSPSARRAVPGPAASESR